MNKKSTSQSAFFNPRMLVVLVFCLAAVFIALLGLGAFSKASAQENAAEEPKAQQVGETTVIPAIHSDLSRPLREQPLIWPAMVDGELPFDLADTDEFIEGCTRGLDPRVMKRLKRGEFSVQSHLDLHGLLKDAAKLELEKFISAARAAGKRCVLVVHGRGLHSKDQVPVLKEALKGWMHTARFSRHVLAFTTARPHDGGAGAVYVLLKKL